VLSIVIGIDPSYTGCGLIVLDTDTGELKHKEVITTNSKDSEIKRVRQIWTKIAVFLNTKEPVDVVSLEGLAFDKGEKAHQMGYLHYRLREYLESYKPKPTIIIPTPNQLKKFITGKGQVKKELILLNVYKRWGVEFDNNNLADAYGLAQLGRAFINKDIKLTSYQQEAIKAIRKEDKHG